MIRSWLVAVGLVAATFFLLTGAGAFTFWFWLQVF
jgi:hypothetical protein